MKKFAAQISVPFQNFQTMSFSTDDLFGDIDDIGGFSDDDNLVGTSKKRKQSNHNGGYFNSNKKIRQGKSSVVRQFVDICLIFFHFIRQLEN